MSKYSRRTKITQATLKKLPKDDKDCFVRDTSLVGFQIKIPPSGRAVYQVEARLSGIGRVKKFKIALVGDIPLSEAKKKALEALGQIRSGVDPLMKKKAQALEGITLEDLFAEYIKVRNLKERTATHYAELFQRRFKNWKNKKVSELTRYEISDWYQSGRSTQADTDGAFRLLNSLMRFACGSDVIAINPCAQVNDRKMRYRVKSRSKHIEPNYALPKFLKALVEYPFKRDSEQVARDLILLILVTGLRKNEACQLKWRNVNFDEKYFLVPDTKNGENHTVPMTPLIFSLLKFREQNALSSEYVFRIKGNSKNGYVTSFQKTLDNICNKAGIPKVSAHDLRRTCATALNSIGVNYADVKKIMNHRAQDITSAVYIQPDREKMRKILSDLVEFYDMKIPHFSLEGFSPYTTGVLAFKLYNVGEPSPIELGHPMEGDVEWQQFSDSQIWQAPPVKDSHS